MTAAGSNLGPAAKARSVSLAFPKLDYEARVTDEEARVLVEISAESFGKEMAAQTLFEGDVALLPVKLPAPLRIEREGTVFKLRVSKPGRYQFKLDLIAKIKH